MAEREHVQIRHDAAHGVGNEVFGHVHAHDGVLKRAINIAQLGAMLAEEALYSDFVPELVPPTWHGPERIVRLHEKRIVVQALPVAKIEID